MKLPGAAWAKPHVDLKDQRIFIVDDEDLNIRVARKNLKSWGYEKIESTNQPSEAISRIRQADPHLVLLDVMMPEISGLELLAQLRGLEETQHLPIVILTAHIEDSVKHQALQMEPMIFSASRLIRSSFSLASEIYSILAFINDG